ncbi:hypothetical protein THRCLA_05161 [Thraustotheca clavata]|uniref:30S ribosomal protein S15 n=1 Tax=Thraustotheca clavata TaxID=74557 RepID=A0A1V9ZWU7_9STRA|nr:hypothetical protein THRCLA_05161 [Thraustotheca clavata]
MLRSLAIRSLVRPSCTFRAFSDDVLKQTYNYTLPEELNGEKDLRMGFKPVQLRDAPDAVHRMLSFENASQEELNKMKIQKAIQAFQRFPGDTGSSEVQVAILTQKIKRMTEHFKEHKKDNHSRRGLQTMISRRKKLLEYLRRENLTKYRAVVAALGLRFS